MGYPQPDRRYDTPNLGSYPQPDRRYDTPMQGSFPERGPEIDIEAEIRKYIDPDRNLLYRPGVDKFEIRRPVFRPGVDSVEIQPLDFLNQTLEQNKEVMGLKEQVFPRFADPADGTLNNTMIAADPGLMPGERPGYGPATPMEMRDSILERLAPGGLQRARDVLYGRTPLRGV